MPSISANQAVIPKESTMTEVIVRRYHQGNNVGLKVGDFIGVAGAGIIAATIVNIFCSDSSLKKTVEKGVEAGIKFVAQPIGGFVFGMLGCLWAVIEVAGIKAYTEVEGWFANTNQIKYA